MEESPLDGIWARVSEPRFRNMFLLVGFGILALVILSLTLSRGAAAEDIYLKITYTEGGTEIENKSVDINYMQWGYASLYNESGYIGLVKANWTAEGFGGATPSFGPTPANNTWVNVGSKWGMVLWNASYFNGTYNDTVKFTVNPPSVDYVEITESPDGTPVSDATVPHGYNKTGNISLYNDTEGYVGSIIANWSAEGGDGATPWVNTTSGATSKFEVGFNSGYAMCKVLYKDTIGNHTDTVNFTVVPPTVDYMEITDTPGGTPITDAIVNVNYNQSGNASLYNSTVGYFGTVEANWTALGLGGAVPYIGPDESISSWVNVGLDPGTVLWNVSYSPDGGTTWFKDTVTYTVIAPGADYIEITDVPGGIPLSTTFIVDHNHIQWGNASLYNNTYGYIGTVEANWSAVGTEGADPSIGDSQNFSSWVDVGPENGTVYWK
ncbi:MAG: hypothetical protein JSW28_07790, partial [Thermoplasmata archaeon]